MKDTSPRRRTVAQFVRLCGWGAALVLALPVAAETPADAASFYRAFGGRSGIHALTEDFVGRLLADVRIQGQFKDSKLSRLKEKLEEQICQAVGGPCTYTGDPMREVHQGMHITTADFNALVEDLQAAMDAQGIPFARQNALLALLAPMHREIIHPAP
jgi:hemoglobin